MSRPHPRIDPRARHRSTDTGSGWVFSQLHLPRPLTVETVDAMLLRVAEATGTSSLGSPDASRSSARRRPEAVEWSMSSARMGAAFRGGNGTHFMPLSGIRLQVALAARLHFGA